ncbi:hypothetical protein [Streptococcus pyogenes]|uniref:hypothetical protein n=1 Tax=Streptococcus pyogenes TaxID=1314 RepID=UPI001F624A5D|nr:hypothetical protein [Streptococcus pyogenes]
MIKAIQIELLKVSVRNLFMISSFIMMLVAVMWSLLAASRSIDILNYGLSDCSV